MEISYPILIYASVFLGLVWAIFNICAILSIEADEEPIQSNQDFKTNSDEENTMVESNPMATVKSIGLKIQKGAYAFLFQEYMIMFVFVVIFGGIVLVVVDFYGKNGDFEPTFYAFVAFVIGSITSMICGWVGMVIGVKANYRTTIKAT